ncbi:hypothetical protein JT358_16840 [Micrococcales bacterium 31B]|nr:hypothetical protein [Micrococcales bacterium 31B]
MQNTQSSRTRVGFAVAATLIVTLTACSPLGPRNDLDPKDPAMVSQAFELLREYPPTKVNANISLQADLVSTETSLWVAIDDDFVQTDSTTKLKVMGLSPAPIGLKTIVATDRSSAYVKVNELEETVNDWFELLNRSFLADNPVEMPAEITEAIRDLDGNFVHVDLKAIEGAATSDLSEDQQSCADTLVATLRDPGAVSSMGALYQEHEAFLIKPTSTSEINGENAQAFTIEVNPDVDEEALGEAVESSSVFRTIAEACDDDGAEDDLKRAGAESEDTPVTITAKVGTESGKLYGLRLDAEPNVNATGTSDSTGEFSVDVNLSYDNVEVSAPTGKVLELEDVMNAIEPGSYDEMLKSVGDEVGSGDSMGS